MKLAPLAAVALCVTFAAAPAQAQSFVLNGVTHCGGNLTNPEVGVHFNLPAGTHNVQWVSGAYSLWSSNGENGGNTWIAVARAYVYATGETITFGSTDGFQPTSSAAEAGALGTYPITLTTASQVSFYLSDGGGCGDNRGNITLQLESPVPTVPATWGAIKGLYR